MARATRPRTFRTDLFDLVKLRICLLSLVMATMGFVLAGGQGVPFRWGLYVATLVGLTLVGAGCGALNHYLERDLDKLMDRTKNRPLPTGRFTTRFALLVGFWAAIVGEVVLFAFVNFVTGMLGLLTLIFYLGIYTPSKRTTSVSTLIGAVPERCRR